MVIGIDRLVVFWLIIAKDVVVTVAQDLASAKLYINVTKVATQFVDIKNCALFTVFQVKE